MEVSVPLPGRTPESCVHIVQELIKYVLFMTSQMPGVYEDMKKIAGQAEAGNPHAVSKLFIGVERNGNGNAGSDADADAAYTHDEDNDSGHTPDTVVDVNRRAQLREQRREEAKARVRQRRQRIAGRKVAKFMAGLDAMLESLDPRLFAHSGVNAVLLLLGPSPLRPRAAYHLKLGPTSDSNAPKLDFADAARAHKKLVDSAKKFVRALVSEGVATSPVSTSKGGMKLFLMLEMPACEEPPQNFLPKRGFNLVCRKMEPVYIDLRSPTESSAWKIRASLQDPQLFRALAQQPPVTATDYIWYQCRFVVKGLQATSLPL
eukprot:jgi/Chlat1/6993/Chrsp56S06656